MAVSRLQTVGYPDKGHGHIVGGSRFRGYPDCGESRLWCGSRMWGHHGGIHIEGMGHIVGVSRLWGDPDCVVIHIIEDMGRLWGSRLWGY